MKSFKPDQKVVFSTKHLYSGPNNLKSLALMLYGMIYPNEKEVVTILKESEQKPGWYILKEYPCKENKKLQAFSYKCLFPIDEINSALTDEIVKDCERAWKKGEEILKEVEVQSC